MIPESANEMTIMGLTTTPGTSGAYALVLTEKSGSRRLPIVIGGFEAQAIALELESIRPPRPMTHDLMKEMLERTDAAVHSIYIHTLEEGTFFAQIFVENDKGTLELDARPSDAIAIAIRFEAPIYVAKEVLDEAGLYSDDEPSGGSAKQSSPKESPKTKLETLEEELQMAIDTENYEKAAKLRDQIQSLKG